MNGDDLHHHAEQLFRGLLWRKRVQPLATAVAALVDEVLGRDHTPSTSEEVLREVYQRTRGEVLAHLISRAGSRRHRMIETMVSSLPPPLSSDFHCDAGLGGLARWLRAAGYDAAFWRDIDDDQLLRKMTNSGAVLLTSDRRLMDRGVITSGAIAALLVPISLKKREQFAFVRRQLELPLRDPRCMACGGRLVAVEKEAVQERIPPRTYPWRDDYYICERCDRLFWKGTHWERIEAALGRS